MKKSWMLTAFAALALLSCAKEAAETILPSEETVTPAPEGYVRYEITASADRTRTAVGADGSVRWNAGDRIAVVYDGGRAVSEQAVIDGDGSVAKFTVLLPQTLAPDAALYGVYPAGTTAAVSDGVLQVTIPDTQDADFAQADIIAAATTLSALNFRFQQVCGLVSFTISEGNPKAVTRALFKDLYGTAVAGTLPLAFSADGSVTPGEPTDVRTEIVLESVEAGENYLAVLPGAALQSVGLKLGTADAWLTPLASDADLTAARATVKPLGTVDTRSGDAYYVKAGAAGTGTSWEDAADVSLFGKLMSTAGERSADTWERRRNAWKLDGYEIRVAEGTYVLPATDGYDYLLCDLAINDFVNEASFAIKGGYGTDGAADPAAKATFSGESSHPILALWENVTATLENIIFKDGNNTAYAGIGGALDLDNGGQFTLNHCAFLDNSNTADVGGAVAVTAGSTSVSFFDCLFSGNSTTGKNGGAIFVGNSDVSMDQCTFTGNKTVTSGFGGALYFNAPNRKNTLTITRSTFGGETAAEGNTAPVGGAALWLSNGLSATLSDCTFQNNRAGAKSGANYGCVGISDKMPTSFKNCKFLSSTGGAVDVLSAWPTSAPDTYDGEYVSFDGCLFQGNTTDYRGAGLWYPGTMPVFLNACVFKGETLTGSQASGVSLAMEAATRDTRGKIGINNCTFSGCAFSSTGNASNAGFVYLRGLAIVSNSTVTGGGTPAALTFNHSDAWGSVTGSMLVNNLVCGEQTYTYGGAYNPLRFVGIPASSVSGSCNLYQGIGGSNYSNYAGSDDSIINAAWSDYGFSENTDGLLDYSIPTGYAVTRILDQDEVGTAIKGQADFGSLFYDWLVSVDGLSMDAAGHSRAGGNRQGALVR